MEARKFLPLLTLVIVLTLSAILWFYPPTGDFRIDNPFWNGITTLSNQANILPLDSLSNLPFTTKGTALLIIPYNQFTEPELAQVKNYVSTGGTLVLLDDYGFGNQVLSALGTNMKFTGQPLLDPLFDYHNKRLPKITDFTSTPMSTNVSSIIFNHASTLDVASDATVIAYSSSFSFLDANSNEAWDANETTGPLPVAAYVKIGQGYVVAVADPSLLINSMINLDDNLQFVNNVAGIQSASPQVYVDQAHLPKAPLDDAKASLAFVYGAVVSPLGTLGLIAVILAISLKPIFNKVKK